MKYLAAVIIATLVSAAAAQKPADLVIVNADVRTMNDRQPTAQAVAIAGNKIAAVGANDEIKRLVGDSTRVIDAGGRLVLPGFNDAHVHFAAIGNKFSSIDLRDARTPDDVAAALAFHARFLPKGRWILGGQWSFKIWPSGVAPHRELLDAVTQDNPVFLYNSEPTTAFVNTAALRLARIDKGTRSPAGGVIETGKDGEPTGILRGSALELVRRLVPSDHEKNWPEIIETASNYATSLGITSVQDTHSDDLLSVYRDLESKGRLKTRVYDCVSLSDRGKVVQKVTSSKDEGLARRGCLKSFSDGDAEWARELEAAILAADKSGDQVAVHAIGETSNSTLADILLRTVRTNGTRDRRFRIEHAERASPLTIRKYGSLRAIASIQPYLFNGGVGRGYYGSLTEAGVILAMGSDAPMTDLDPMKAIVSATKKTNGEGSALTVTEVIRAYTAGSAFAEFQDKVKGKIAVGMLADLVVLSDNIFIAQGSALEGTKAVLTILDGKVVYDDKNSLPKAQ